VPAVAERQVSLEFVFDRAGEATLARAYRALVPERFLRSVHQSRQGDDQLPAASGGIGRGGRDAAEESESEHTRALGA
jgi:hypothetical protein